MSALSWIFFKQGKLQEAKSKIEAAIELNDQVSIYHFRLGRILWEQGASVRSGNCCF